MFAVVLVHPEIPPNTGNIIRLCANTGAILHLVRPLGFRMEDRELRRAGLDYSEYAEIVVHDDWQHCKHALGSRRTFACTTKAAQHVHTIRYQTNDVFVFGSETNGLPAEVFADHEPQRRIRLPMLPNRRSLNLSNAVAIVVYEAWRQLEFAGGM